MRGGHLTLLLTALLGGCANLNSIHHRDEFVPGINAVTYTDVKQRMVYTATDRSGHTVICAEPSPDALSAYAAELAAKVTTPQAGAELSGASQESAGFVGLRTSSIQLLRDAMYRLCESRANNAINELDYAVQMRRFQKNMVALLAIEQLTGTIKSPPVTINTSGAATTESLSQTQAAMEDAIAKRGKAAKEQADQQASMDAADAAMAATPAPTGVDLKKLLSAKQDAALNVENARLEQEAWTDRINALNANVRNGRSGTGVNGAASALANGGNSSNPVTPATVEIITKAVTSMVSEILKGNDTLQVCNSYMSSVMTSAVEDAKRVPFQQEIWNSCWQAIQKSDDRQAELIRYAIEHNQSIETVAAAASSAASADVMAPAADAAAPTPAEATPHE